MKHDRKWQHIIRKLQQLKEFDSTFLSGRILGSMCTQPHPIALEAYSQFLATNLGDPALFPGSKKIEKKYIDFIKELLHVPSAGSGVIVSGGTEGNITAMWLAKLLSGKSEIIVPEGVHFSFRKIASLMNMKLTTVPLTNKYIIDIQKLQKKIGKNTAAVLAIAGSTELGMIDPIDEISELCSNEDVFLHVDAAFGGFAIPFLNRLGFADDQFDFNLEGVSSVSVDAHKMGCSAIPLGTLLVRDNRWLDMISGEPDCTSSSFQVGLLGTRSGGPVAAGYAISQYLGYDGYTDIMKQCMKTTAHTIGKISELGLSLVVQPKMNVIGVKLKDPEFVVRRLADQGWRVNKIERLSCIRIVLMPHISKKHIDEFMPVFKQVCMEAGEL